VNPQAFRIGSVHYLNALPLTHGLGNDLVLLPPSKLAVEMHAGRLDAALLSITEALFHPEHEILDGVGILSRGPVYSVGLAHRQPLAAIREIHLDPASCTSVNLLRILLDRCGCDPRFVPLDDYASAPSLDNVLLIGNPAIDFRRTHGGNGELPGTTGHQWLDLGELWQAQEQLPFTYAAWVLRKDSPTALRRLLLDSAAQGLAALPTIVASRSEYDPDFRHAYLGGYIQYRMDAPARAGIRRFATHLAALSERPVHPPRFVK
jgi:chorismate dehydratase